MSRIGTGLAWLATLLCVALVPPVASRWFALEPLQSSESALLVGGAAIVLLLAWTVLRPAANRSRLAAKIGLALLALFAGELAVRFVVTNFTSYPRRRLARIARATQPERLVIDGHPFAQFVGRPGRQMEGSATFSVPSPFNEFGFPEPTTEVAKRPGETRVLCLGGSTTMRYPSRMLKWLQEQSPEQDFSALNLSFGWYTTAHSVVNFSLTGLDYQPDYVVLHHGWNDGCAAHNAAEFRGDYSHVFSAFEPPRLRDDWMIRASVVYRAVRFALTKQDWTMLDVAIQRPVDPALGYDLNLALDAYERNIRTVVDLALVREIVPVLVTLPHSTDPDILAHERRPELIAFAKRLRAITADYGSRAVFVDLGLELTGHNELFEDIGHLTPAGQERKARAIGAAILRHRGARSNAMPGEETFRK